MTTSEGKRRILSTSNGTNTNRVRQADDREEHADTDARGDLDGSRDGLHQPLSHAEEGQEQKDQAFDKDGSEGQRVRDVTGSMPADDLVGEVGVDAHARTVEILH